MTELTDHDSPVLTRVLEYLERFEWKPEKVENIDGQITIILVAQLDIKEIKIYIKFKEKSHWIYFSAMFISNVSRNLFEVYKRLLEINYTTTLTKFGISSTGAIYALTELPSQNIDYEEFLAALRRLTNDVNTYTLPIANMIQKVDEP